MTAAALLLLALVAAPSPQTTPPTGARYYARRTAADLAFAARRYTQAESLYAGLADAGRDPWVWFRLGQSRQRLERHREAASAFERALALGTRPSAEGRRTQLEYRVARCLALAGERDSAFTWLARAIDDGYDDRPGLADDAAFASLRSDPRFAPLAGGPAPNAGRDAGWRSDLAFLVAEIRRVHVRYRNEPLPSGFTEEAQALDADIPRLSDAAVYLRMQRLVARLGDGHSVLYPFGDRLSLPILPVGFHQFADGWFVVEASESLRAHVGERLLAIGGVPIDTLASRVAPVISRDNPQTIAWIAPLYLRFGAVVAALGGSRDSSRATLTLVDGRGRRSDVIVSVDPSLHPAAPKLGRAPGGSAPLWLQATGRPFWTAPLPAPRALYVQFNQVADADSESLHDFAFRLRRTLARDGTTDLVVDVRHNNGGDGYKLAELVRTLVWFTADDPSHRLFVLIGRGTFSAAQVFVNQLDRDANPIFAGEPTGSRPDFPGEDTSIRLPWSGVRGSLSSRWHMVDGADTRLWIAPEIPVALHATDYFANRDPVLDAVLEVMNTRP